MVSNALQNDCCGTTCDKADLVGKVRELEQENHRLQNVIDDIVSSQFLENEVLAHKCFNAGYLQATHSTDDINKAWLNFKATEL